ncbi:MAG: efflux RND transporter periplasmic adaptor subunit [Bacteroidales bacterium]|nr:efflux RND transporter periplasmic adaptor subunit [Bacteroidales bacterium]
MKNIFSKTKSFVKNNKWWSFFIAIIILFLFYSLFIKKPEEVKRETYTVERRNLTEEVSTTGNVKPLSNIDLSFEMGGKISNIAVSVGSKVYQGQYLASISNADLSAALEQAKANLKATEANLEILKNGATPEQIAVSQSQLEKANSDLTEAKISFINTIQDSYTKSDDAIRNKADTVFDNPRASDPKIKFQVTEPQLSININLARLTIENMLVSWNSDVINLIQSSDLTIAENLAIKNLNTVKNFLEQINLALNSAITNSSITEAQITEWKTTITTARTNIALAISGLSTASTQYKSASALVKVAENQLSLTKAAATPEEIKAKEALVDQAKASVESAKANLEKSIIRSPISGTISRIDGKTGETVQAGSNVISVISAGEYQVESYVPEADIAKVKIGNRATTTLDAYGEDVYFETIVIKIDPAETVISGVSTYKVTFKFASSSDQRIKSGMTANIDILTDQKDNSLAVPSRAVFSDDGEKYVIVVDKSNLQNSKEVVVKTGIRGVDSYTEILSGIKEGDIILISNL